MFADRLFNFHPKAPCTLLRPLHHRIAPARQVLRSRMLAGIPRQTASGPLVQLVSDFENARSP